MDRDSAISATGAQLAAEIMENELIMKTDAYQNGNLVILENPGICIWRRVVSPPWAS